MQVYAERDARSFWCGGRGSGFAGLTKPNYEPTSRGRRIGCHERRGSLLSKHPATNNGTFAVLTPISPQFVLAENATFSYF